MKYLIYLLALDNACHEFYERLLKQHSKNAGTKSCREKRIDGKDLLNSFNIQYENCKRKTKFVLKIALVSPLDS